MGDDKKKKEKVQDPLDTTMSLGDHLEELRARILLALAGLLVGVIVCLIPFFFRHIKSFIYQPLGKLPDPNQVEIIAIAPADPFIVYMKMALIAGLIITSPWVFYQLWMFVSAGLYPHERRYVHIAVPFSAALFVTGALFFLFIVAPISLRFFLGFATFIGVEAKWTLQKYVSFVTMLMLVFGLAFQTPIAIFILNKTGLVSIQALRKSRKYVLLAMFIIAAVATPPDVISQVTLAIPLYFLFELGILLSYLSGRKKVAQNNQS